MLNVVLFQPEIPPNTGNIIRLCANAPARLHLIGPLGFVLDDRRLRRAGLDHSDRARISQYHSIDQCLDALPSGRWLAFSTRARRCYSEWQYQPGDVLLFGPETRGLPDQVLDRFEPDRRLRIPQQAGSRSLNLSNSVAIAVYEGWRQLGFAGRAGDGE
ncbi:MAG: tRNA (cytidine(34)-2'-O)-methyltransferase [Wenzhouxiangella sp.]|nr:MAG: tRNA (cytidine(34)-2'-O)-methyltransferase [Wenzhouxiangella sp.]